MYSTVHFSSVYTAFTRHYQPLGFRDTLSGDGFTVDGFTQTSPNSFVLKLPDEQDRDFLIKYATSDDPVLMTVNAGDEAKQERDSAYWTRLLRDDLKIPTQAALDRYERVTEYLKDFLGIVQ